MSALIVHFPPQPISAATEFEYAVTHDSATVASHGSAPASVLPLPTRAGSEVVAVVPAAMLSWHRVELPQGMTARSPRLRAVLEGLLEDRLLDEPEALHFAVQPQVRAGTGLWVATCDRAWLRDALQVLETNGRPATRIVPEFAPEGPTALYALGDPQHAQLVVAGSEGVTALPLGASALALLPELPEGTPCIAEPAVAALAEQVLQHQPVLQQATERWVQSAQSAWDLAQFDLSSSSQARALKKLGTAWADLLAAPQWRPARWGALLLVALNLVGLNAWAWRERSVQDEKLETIRSTLTKTFPQVRVVTEVPALQMEREVAVLRQSAGATSGRDLEAMLAALSTVAPPQRPAAAIDYTPGELRVKGLALSADESRTLAASLKAQGYAANAAGDTLVITAEGQP